MRIRSFDLIIISDKFLFINVAILIYDLARNPSIGFYRYSRNENDMRESMCVRVNASAPVPSCDIVNKICNNE